MEDCDSVIVTPLSEMSGRALGRKINGVSLNSGDVFLHLVQHHPFQGHVPVLHDDVDGRYGTDGQGLKDTVIAVLKCFIILSVLRFCVVFDRADLFG